LIPTPKTKATPPKKKETLELDDTLEQNEPERQVLFQTAIAQYMFFSLAHGTFSKNRS
jgi:hypothetical protein